MRKSLKNYILDLLADYNKIPEYIAEREDEIRHPIVERDENVGGGRAQNKPGNPTERLVITLTDDLRLKNLEKEYEVITDCYNKADPDTQTIVRELCFKDRQHQTYTMQGLYFQGKIHVSPSKGYELRNEFIKKVAQGFGFDDM